MDNLPHSAATTTDSSASALLKRAHESHHRWSSDFGGLAARVSITSELGRSIGQLRVHRGGGASVRPLLGDPLPPACAAEVIQLVGRLTAKPYEQLDGRYGGRFRSRLDLDGATAVVLVGDPRRTVRWIRDDRLVRTEFDFAGDQHHIEVLATTPSPDGRWLPATTSERRTRDGVTLHREVEERWDVLDGVVVPAGRTVRCSGGPAPLIEVEISGHQLLGA